MNSEAQVDLSIVIPAFNEEQNVRLLHKELCDVLEGIGRRAEIIFVDDGSTDGTFEALQELHERDPRVKVIRFGGNSGKAAGYSAGFDHASGGYVFTMDSDLQDNPADLPKLLAKLVEGHDLVVGWKHQGKGPWAKRVPSRVFNAVVRRVTGIRLHDLDSPFRGFRREVLSSLKVYGELYRYIPILVASKGFRVTEVPIENRPRVHGSSKFGVERFLRGGLDLFTVLFITKYLGRPLHLFGGLGLLSAGLGFTSILTLYLLKFLFGVPIRNTPFLFGLAVLAVILGVQLFSLGLVSQLLIEVNKRPGDNYQIADKIW